QKIGKPQQAVATFKRFLDDDGAGEDPESQSKAREYLVQAEKDLDADKRRLPAAPMAPSPGPYSVATIPSTALPQTAERSGLHKKWWLWTAVGGAAAGLVIGLG